MNSKGNLKATLQKKHVSLVQIMRYSGQRSQQIETSKLQMNIFDINANIIKHWVLVHIYVIRLKPDLFLRYCIQDMILPH